MRSINLTPEKNATRSVGVYVADNYEKLGVKGSEYISSYNNLTKDQWLDFDRLVEESTVFMFVRNPFDRVMSQIFQVKRAVKIDFDYNELVNRVFGKILLKLEDL